MNTLANSTSQNVAISLIVVIATAFLLVVLAVLLADFGQSAVGAPGRLRRQWHEFRGQMIGVFLVVSIGLTLALAAFGANVGVAVGVGLGAAILAILFFFAR